MDHETGKAIYDMFLYSLYFFLVSYIWSSSMLNDLTLCWLATQRILCSDSAICKPEACQPNYIMSQATHYSLLAELNITMLTCLSSEPKLTMMQQAFALCPHPYVCPLSILHTSHAYIYMALLQLQIYDLSIYK